MTFLRDVLMTNFFACRVSLVAISDVSAECYSIKIYVHTVDNCLSYRWLFCVGSTDIIN